MARSGYRARVTAAVADLADEDWQLAPVGRGSWTEQDSTEQDTHDHTEDQA